MILPGPILHHYPRSPYAEKVRRGLKGLEYRAVIVPSWMPKPGLMPLTGGYRRTPVMQWGADVYCDTLLILEEIERRHPTPTLFPGESQALATALGWAIEKSIFVAAVGVIVGLTGQGYPRALVEDRGPFFGFSLEHAPMLAKQSLFVDRLNAHLVWLSGLRRDGRAFLLGQAPSAADLAAYHPLWHLRRAGGDPAAAQTVLTLLPRLSDLLGWMDRVAAIGHGTPHEIAAKEALAEARNADPAPPDLASIKPGTAPVALHGIEVGSEVTMTPDDSGRDPVRGRLVAVTDTRVVLRRTDPGLGEINVHFPRAGFDAATA